MNSFVRPSGIGRSEPDPVEPQIPRLLALTDSRSRPTAVVVAPGCRWTRFKSFLCSLNVELSGLPMEVR